MTSQRMRGAATAIAGTPRNRILGKSSGFECKRKSHSGPAPRAVLLPVLNDDLHVVGHSYCVLGEGLRAQIKAMAEGEQ